MHFFLLYSSTSTYNCSYAQSLASRMIFRLLAKIDITNKINIKTAKFLCDKLAISVVQIAVKVVQCSQEYKTSISLLRHRDLSSSPSG